MGITVDERALAVMRVHFDLLLRWNARINLTAIRDPDQILRRHFAESLFLTRVIAFGPGILYDIGSGAGFPGLPLKAAHPEINLVLVESSQKKAAFLKEVIRAAGLEGVRVEAKRAEELAAQGMVEAADWITVRAVGNLKQMLPHLWCLLAARGQLALFLGVEDAGRLLSEGGGLAWQAPVPIPGSQRRVILVGRHQDPP